MEFSKRTHTERIIIINCTIGSLIITPFGILRYFQGDYKMMAVDLLLGLFIGLIALYVAIYRKTKNPIIIVTILSYAGVIGAVFLKGANLVYWTFPLIIALYYVLPAKLTFTFNMLTILIVLTMCFEQIALAEFLSLTITLIASNFFSLTFALQSEEHRGLLSQQALNDGLTGAPNRRALDQRFDEINKQQETTSLLLIDIDHFKSINDQLGHLVGDEVLINLVKLVQTQLRKEDIIYRYGGEEFVLIAPETSLSNAFKLGEKVRKFICEQALLDDRKVTVSLGIAELKHGEDISACFARSDSALYEAKQSGRNKTCIAT